MTTVKRQRPHCSLDGEGQMSILKAIILSVALIALSACTSLEKKERLPMRGPSILKMLVYGHDEGVENAVNIEGYLEVTDEAVVYLFKEQKTEK